MPSALFSPLTLPNGPVLGNRLVKAAMEEHMAGRDNCQSSRSGASPRPR